MSEAQYDRAGWHSVRHRTERRRQKSGPLDRHLVDIPSPMTVPVLEGSMDMMLMLSRSGSFRCTGGCRGRARARATRLGNGRRAPDGDVAQSESNNAREKSPQRRAPYGEGRSSRKRWERRPFAGGACVSQAESI